MGNTAVLKSLKEKFGKAKIVTGGGYRIVCPTCTEHDSKKMKRYVHPNWGVSNCFICNKIIPLVDLLKDDQLAVRIEASADDADAKEHPFARIPPYKSLQRLDALDFEAPAIQFLTKDWLYKVKKYSDLGIGYIPSDGGENLVFDSGFKLNTSESLYFPVYHDRALVGWQLRFVPGTWNGDRFQFMRYLHLFPKGDYLYNYDEARQHTNVVVVEGVKKALKLPNAVATLGKGVSDKQKQLIVRWRQITIMLDGDEKTQVLARQLQRDFSFSGRTCVNINTSDYGLPSPDEATTEQLEYMIKEQWMKQK